MYSCPFFRNPSRFDLMYYNGLGQQDQEIRLSIGNWVIAQSML